MKPLRMWLLLMTIIGLSFLPTWALAREGISSQTKECLGCHESMPGIVVQWRESAHWKAGVGCFECHQAKKGTRMP